DHLVEAHRIDLSDAQAVLGVDRPQVHAGSPNGPVDLVVVAASLPETPDGDRREFLAANASCSPHWRIRSGGRPARRDSSCCSPTPWTSSPTGCTATTTSPWTG